MKQNVLLLLLCIIISTQLCCCSTIISYYHDTNTTQDAPQPDWAKDIPTYPQDVLSVGFNFSTLTLILGPQNWQNFQGKVAMPTADLCHVKPEDIPQYLTDGEVLIMPKYFGCSRQLSAKIISKYVPSIKALLFYDTADERAFGFSQSFTDGSSTKDINKICLVIPKSTAASLILALEDNYVIELDLHPEIPTWNTLSKEGYLSFQIILLLVAIGVVVFALYRLIVVVRKNRQRKMPILNISVVVLSLELVSNLTRMVLFATQPLLSASGGLGTLSYPAWRVLITFSFPLLCMSSTALILYWHELLLMKMNGTKLAFMTNPKSKAGFSAVTVITFIINIITTALDASGYDVSFFIVLAICIAYSIIITIGTYYVGYKVLVSVKLLPQIRTISIKLILAVSWIWVVVIGALLHLTPAYWSVPNQAVMMAILFIGLWGLSVSNLIVFKQRKSGGSNSKGSGGSGGSSSGADYNSRVTSGHPRGNTIAIYTADVIASNTREDKEEKKASPKQVMLVEVQSASAESTAQNSTRTHSSSISSHVDSSLDQEQN